MERESVWGKRLRWLALRDLSKRGRVAVLCVLLSTLVFGAGAFGLAVVQAAPGGVQLAIAANASCAALARADQTATNGSNWGRTILSGHNAYHGWFGVDVCSNGSNYVAPNSANVSCDAIPKNWNKAGCAPGGATSDGFGLTFQCVELVARFSAWAYGDAPGRWLGNAPDLWLPGNHPSDFVMYPNGSSHAPVPGDILVWGSLDAHGNPWPAGPDGQDGGHVAVLAAVHDGLIVTAEENVKWGSDDHPSDTLGLTKVGSRWIVSGTSAHDTHLPTYRWRSTMGTARGMYGWLHSTRNDGTFPASKHPATSVPKTPGKAPQQTSGGLPSLAAATLVTDSGGLADLVWTTTSLFGTAPTDGTAYATARSLGAPTPARLITGQTPATVLLPDGTRYSYAVGADGHLYVARTSPRTIGVYWFDHGAPPNVMLEPFLSATRFASGMAVAALGSDGNMWWRAGPDGSLGDWMPLGRPGNVGLTGSFALAGAPGQGTPLVLALGQDGTLYERVWQNALLDGDGNVSVPAGWSDWIAIAAQLHGPRLAGKLVVMSETPGTHSLIGAWADTPLDVFGLDERGTLVWLRMQALQSGWTLRSANTPEALTALAAGAAVAGDAAGTSSPSVLHIYATGAHGIYQGAVPVASAARATSVQPTWISLASAPAGAALSGALALPLGPGTSVAVAADGDELVAGGPALGTSVLAASTNTTAPAAGQPQAGWVHLGKAASPMTFSDPLGTSVLNAHWYMEGDNAQARPGSNGVQLSATGGTAALIQGAPMGDATVTAQVAMPAHAGAGTQAGLVLYLDEGDWLTLLEDGRGHVAFCGAALQQALPCASAAISGHPASGTLGLQITRTSDTYSAEMSADGVTWTTVGQISPAEVVATSAATATPTSSPSASATPRSTATPTVAATGAASAVTMAPLAFSECGLYVEGSAPTSAAPTFAQFIVVSTSGPLSGVGG